VGDVIYTLADGTRLARQAAVARALPVSAGTLASWRQTGAVRSKRDRGGRWLVLDDVVFMLSHDPQETRAAGIRRTSEEKARATRLLNQASAERSRRTATRHRDEWTLDELLRVTADDRPADEVLARELGRTVKAVQHARWQVQGGALQTYPRDELEALIAAAFGRR